ncbi:zinc ribbon domain-containing protein [Methanobrevibacter sp.]|uniref:zinc ribbon domain-containing protein n=1 Tax=Methanobrevibacter sp. TaxID=66852 RepID=UPI00386F4B9C
MVKCPRCGYENSTASTYCVNCMYVLSQEKGETVNNSKNNKGWNISIARKLMIVLGLIVIILLLFSFVNNNSQVSQNDTLNVVADDGSHHQSASYPFKAIIKGDGDWSAKMGNPSYLVEKSGSGTRSFSLDCAAWDDVEIDAQKNSGEGELKIQLLRNGEVVAENSTTNGSDVVKLYFDS